MWIWLIFQPANRSYNNWQPTARSCCLRGWSLPSPSASGDTAKALPIAGPSMEIKMACQVGSRFSPIGCCFGITKIGIFFWWENNDDKNVVFFWGGRGKKINMVTGCWIFGVGCSMAIHGPGVLVDRFGSSAVVTFEVVGSVKLELLVQDGRELGNWGRRSAKFTIKWLKHVETN